MYKHLPRVLVQTFFLIIAFYIPSSLQLSSVAVPSSSLQKLTGDWIDAKHSLRQDDCCVVRVPGIDESLRILKDYFVDKGPANIDLRARVHVKSNIVKDCLKIRQSVIATDEDDIDIESIENYSNNDVDQCTAALVELAKGVASLADGPLEGVCTDVFIRIVCASDYRAIDPMFHTDKAPLRGYVTLAGPGTEYMARTCSPVEYVSLRSLGQGNLQQSIRQASNVDFIVMKGDHYIYDDPERKVEFSTSIMKNLWKRTCACVHRSPPGNGGRRVIVSLDLADGDDDREWYEKDKKREWRAGMTQRKSRLVA